MSRNYGFSPPNSLNSVAQGRLLSRSTITSSSPDLDIFTVRKCGSYEIFMRDLWEIQFPRIQKPSKSFKSWEQGKHKGNHHSQRSSFWLGTSPPPPTALVAKGLPFKSWGERPIKSDHYQFWRPTEKLVTPLLPVPHPSHFSPHLSYGSYGSLQADMLGWISGPAPFGQSLQALGRETVNPKALVA